MSNHCMSLESQARSDASDLLQMLGSMLLSRIFCKNCSTLASVTSSLTINEIVLPLPSEMLKISGGPTRDHKTVWFGASKLGNICLSLRAWAALLADSLEVV